MATAAPAVPEVQSARSFNALNGTEIKKAILAQIQNYMDRDTRFSQHLAYGRLGWRWKIAIDIYPNDMDKKFDLEAGGTLLPPEPRREITVDETPIQIDIGGERTVAAPIAGDTADQVRRDAGLPLPTTKVVSGPEGSRISVDAPEVPAPGHGEDSEVISTSRVETNVPGAKGTVARRVSIKNRANPKGVQVADAAGSAPTEDDMARIIEQGLADGTITKAPTE